MKKFICVLIAVCLLLIIGRFAFRYIDFNKTNDNNQNDDSMVKVNEETLDKKFENSDELYNNFVNRDLNNFELLEKKDIYSEYFNDDEWKELFNQNEVIMTMNKYKTNEVKILDIIPYPDTLFEYIIIQEADDNYGVFSQISQGTGEEVYRYYINNDTIVKKIESKYNEEKIVATKIEKTEIENILLLYNYYINL